MLQSFRHILVAIFASSREAINYFLGTLTKSAIEALIACVLDLLSRPNKINLGLTFHPSRCRSIYNLRKPHCGVRAPLPKAGYSLEQIAGIMAFVNSEILTLQVSYETICIAICAMLRSELRQVSRSVVHPDIYGLLKASHRAFYRLVIESADGITDCERENSRNRESGPDKGTIS